MMWILKRVGQFLGYSRGMGRSDRTPLSTAFAEAAGHWIAVDLATNEIREAADTPDQLVLRIRERGLRDVAVVRAPDPSEPELVGLG